VTGRAGAPRPPRRPRVPKADLSGLLLASMEEVVRIEAGEIPPARVHTAAAITAAAGPQGVQEAVRQARRRLGLGK